MVAALRHLARWLAWQVADHADPAPYAAPARITVFSTGDSALPGDLSA